MRKTILIVTCEAAPNPKRPTSGGTLRIWGIAEGLKSKGFRVLISVPKEKLSDDDPKDLKELAHEYKDIGLVVARSGCNAVIVEQWGTATYLDECGLPYVVDLHGSLALENLYGKGTDITSDAYTKIETLAKADMLTCPNARQKDYFTAWFIMAGRDIKKHPVEVVPIGMPPELPRRSRSKELRVVYGGTMWPWIDPFPGIEIVASKLDRSKKGTLELYVAPPADEGLRECFEELRKRLKGYKSVKWFEHIPRSELLKRYRSAALAFDLYAFNLERYLASTTRTYEYLWCGLPVLYPDYGELADEIETAGAGFVVDPTDTDSIADVVDRILKKPELLWNMGKNAQKLISSRFTWDKTVEPLARFIDKPAHEPASRNIVAAFKETYSRIWGKEIKELEKRIKDYELRFMREIEQKDAELTARQHRITQLEEGMARLQQELHRRNLKIEELSDQKEKLERAWQKKLDDAWAEFRRELQRHRDQTQAEIARHQKIIEDRDNAIASLKREMAQKERELTRRLKEKDEAIQQRDKKIEALSQKWEQ
ncbi:MAG TPA: glycosyltransferase, partial [Proteobacteria bacterium]|nr:glycosyltransferase [Pseudomonadota bacterium]